MRWIPAVVLAHLSASLMAWLLAAPMARAGPWLRDPSLSFASLQVTPRNDGSTEVALFAERGLTPSLTLGVDVNDNGESGHALVFARLPLRQGDWVAAVDLALGGHRYKSDTGAMARALFGIGRNVTIAGTPGWAALAIGPEWRQDNGRAALKTDAVLGFKADRPLNPILSVETFVAPNNDFYWSVIPGVTIRGKDGRTWLVGLEQRGGPSTQTTGLRLGLWWDF